jgi:hypothetical protein
MTRTLSPSSGVDKSTWFVRPVAATIAVLSTLVAACGMPTPPSGEGVKPPKLPEGFKNKCEAAKGQLRPLVVEWAAPDRAALESQARQGQLVVHYQGCELEVLRRCKVPPKASSYGYTAITPKDESVKITSADQLYASIPVNAAKFEGKLAQKGQLSAEMTIVGEYGVAGLPPAVDQLQGDCGGATHVVTALTVGAFAFIAGASNEKGLSASVLGAGAGVESSKSTETLSRDGDVKACTASKRGDPTPPENCGALLRLELAALLPAGEGIPDCKPGTKLDGKKCVPIPKPSKLAPEDESFVDDKKGFGWGTRCYMHLKAGALPFARAACEKGLASDPDAQTRGAILFNYALVEEKAGDPVAACEKFSQSMAVRPSKDVQKKVDELKCSELMKNQ